MEIHWRLSCQSMAFLWLVTGNLSVLSIPSILSLFFPASHLIILFPLWLFRIQYYPSLLVEPLKLLMNGSTLPYPPIFVYHRARAVRGRSCCVAAKRRVGSLTGACMDRGRDPLCIGK
uniref:Uncharacterized protein n=1 Tax=Picea glauca TaxID=3330 RepID=A0A101M052_PICGL|nr:hypothetical protein ABT39_MTgene4599 [Picea glauca]